MELALLYNVAERLDKLLHSENEPANYVLDDFDDDCRFRLHIPTFEDFLLEFSESESEMSENYMRLLTFLSNNVPDGIIPGELTSLTRLFISIHDCLVSSYNCERQSENGRSRTLPLDWDDYNCTVIQYIYGTRIINVSITRDSVTHYVNISVCGRQHSKSLPFSNHIIPTFNDGDVENDRKRFAFVNHFLNHLLTNFIDKVINGSWRSTDSSLVIPDLPL